MVSPKKHTRNQLNELIDNNILFSGWVDSVGCTVKMRKKAIDEVMIGREKPERKMNKEEQRKASKNMKSNVSKGKPLNP